ncbi:hypothetical protein B0A54_12166 [Friedmanniomyces endolithicus]|uniref:SUZ domain-containing protein n=1 Tax=Friedmanniomyces endolithicus TaxID=329885 RepID=A0A4U0UL83_9PEZI|nr:hypothetical protein B0A54_12166 [Friedmanniomyces endolithicus]
MASGSTNKTQKQSPAEEATVAPKLTKSQKRAQHQQLQKQLWDSAENPTRMHWLETQGVVPLKQEFRPQVKLLSRKPQATILKKGATDATIDDGEDSEEEARKKQEAAMEERTRQAKIDREEKQRKYNEARERIMGSSAPGSPMTGSRESSQGRDNRKPRVRVNGNRDSQPTSAAHSPTRNSGTETRLFDPEDMGRRLPKSNTPNPGAPMRQPRAPPSDHTSGEGFGFAGRGGRAPT